MVNQGSPISFTPCMVHDYKAFSQNHSQRSTKIHTYFCVRIYTHIYIYTHIHRYPHTHIYIDTHTHIYIYTYIHIYPHTFTHVLRKYTYVHICTYAYIYIHPHIYIYTYFVNGREPAVGTESEPHWPWSSGNMLMPWSATLSNQPAKESALSSVLHCRTTERSVLNQGDVQRPTICSATPVLSPPPWPLGPTDCCLQIASAGHQLGQSKEQRLEIGEVLSGAALPRILVGLLRSACSTAMLALLCQTARAHLFFFVLPGIVQELLRAVHCTTMLVLLARLPCSAQDIKQDKKRPEEEAWRSGRPCLKRTEQSIPFIHCDAGRSCQLWGSTMRSCVQGDLKSTL